MLPSTAQMWTSASVSPGMSVAPRQPGRVTGAGAGPTGLVVDGLVVAVPRVGLVGEEERVHRGLAVERRAPAEEEHVARVPVLDLVEMRAPLVDDDVGLGPETLELSGDGERDVLVERIAAGRRVER